MSASGKRGEASLAARLKELREARATGAVRVRYPKGSGAVYVSEGQVVHAEHGRVQGEFGYWQLLGLPDVELAFEEDAAPQAHSIQGTLSLEELEPTLAALTALSPSPLEVRPSSPPERVERVMLPPEPRSELRSEPRAEPRIEPRAEPRAGESRAASPRPETGRGRRSARGFKVLEGHSAAALRTGSDPASPVPLEAAELERAVLAAEAGEGAAQARARAVPRGLLIALVAGGGILAAGLSSQSELAAGAHELTRVLGQKLSANPRLSADSAPLQAAASSESEVEHEVAPSLENDRPAPPAAAVAAAPKATEVAAAPSRETTEPAPESAAAVEATELTGAGDRLPVALGSLQLESPQPGLGLLPTLVLRLRLDAKGHVAEASIYQPRPELQAFEQRALERIKQLSFEPALRESRAVSVWLDYAVSFSEIVAGGGR